MGRVIDSSNTSEYNIEKFEFQSLDSDKDIQSKDITSIFNDNIVDNNLEQVENSTDVFDDKKYEELLKKIDELSSEVVTLQMQLEDSKKEHDKELLSEREKSYENGVKEAINNSIGEVEELKIQYISTITKLQESGIKIQSTLDTIEEELVETSIAIAKKVIIKELEESSVLVAKAIGSHLINELRDFTGVRLVVNPVDYEDIMQSFEPKGLSVSKDSSITKGGVMLYNDDENIDATVETRFKRALSLIKES